MQAQVFQTITADIPAIRVGEKQIPLRQMLVQTQFLRRTEAFQAAAEAHFLRDYAQQQGLLVQDDEVQQEADSFRNRHQLLRVANLYSWCATNRLSLDDWGSCIEDQVIRRKVAEAVITNEKLSLYFAEHKAEFDAAELSHCIVGSESTAREMYCQVREGRRDFHYLARHYSLDADTSRKGGYLGWVKRHGLENAELEAKVFGAKPGEVIPPFICGHQWKIVLVESLKPATFDSESDALRERLFEQWLAAELSCAGVERVLLDACQMYPTMEGGQA